MQFKIADFAHLIGPGVYIVMKDNEPIYVGVIGVTKNFLARFGSGTLEGITTKLKYWQVMK